ncbi:hypothetical protein M407DRAFT_31224 [Tulasnella calospora MUT 4182]|uniref:F-box domain-containing protein n=1 Tax=Tulasnella calospora MUT 4182 TaxID=1051891 RepID=A0A0C3Q5Z6_9AGAM|nr:hypothetical protein M407DRAFT_31224 [Tulasnella calospora MUT 4182]
MGHNDNPYTAFLVDRIQAETSRQSYRPTSEVDGMTHFTKIVEQALIAFKRKRNALLRVSTLPIELLATVFEWAVCDEVQKRYMALQRLRLVSFTWRTAIDATPALWSVLSSRHSSRTLDISLERSSNHPLSVWHHLPSLFRSGPDLGISRLLAPSAIQRWKFASLQFTSPEPLVALRQPAPLLEVLQLRVPGRIDRTYWMEDLFHGELPRLKELRLESVAVPWDNQYFPGLRVLDLSCVRQQGPTISQLFSILSQCSKLSIVILDNVVFPPDDCTEQTNIQPTMSSLIQLNLTHLASPSATNRILTSLSLPALKRLKLYCSLLRDEPTTLFNHQLYLRAPTFVPILQNANAVRIELHHNTFTCRALFPEQLAAAQSFTLTIRSSWPASPLRWLLNVLNDVSPRVPAELTFSGNVRFERDQEFFELMLKIPRLVDVSFTEPNEGIPALLARLNACDVDADGVRNWALPDLHILCLSGDHFDVSDVLVMVKSRYGLSGPQQGSKTQHPAPFVLLDVVDNTSSTEETLAEIREIVGDGVLQWDEYYD